MTHVGSHENDPIEQRGAVIERLKPILDAFLHDPTAPSYITKWYEALALHCPLWSLHQMEYGIYEKRPKHPPLGLPRLVNDIGWGFMRRASEDREPLRTFRNRQWVIFSSCVQQGEAEALSFTKPQLDPEEVTVGGRYLVQAYRVALSCPEREDPVTRWRTGIPTPWHLKEKTLRWDEDEPDPYGCLPWDVREDISVGEKLRELVAERDLLPVGPLRDEADTKVDSFLREIGVLGRTKTTVPNAKEFVTALATECLLWLPLLLESSPATVTDAAKEKLTWWHCSDDVGLWAKRLAFPFLSTPEFDKILATSNLYSRKLQAVYLIHFRLHPALTKPSTVADHAFKSTFVKHNIEHLQDNPFQQ